jgi:hypothetical protein
MVFNCGQNLIKAGVGEQDCEVGELTSHNCTSFPFYSMMNNIEETKKQALESVPQIPRGQIPLFMGFWFHLLRTDQTFLIFLISKV